MNIEMQQVAAQSDEELQFNFLLRKDPFLINIRFTSTFSAVYEYNDVEEKNNHLDKEGGLYLLERSIQPYFQIFVLNRKNRDDFEESLEVGMEFTDKDNFVAYTAPPAAGGYRARRTIFFADVEEKQKFMEATLQAIDDLRKMQDSGDELKETYN